MELPKIAITMGDLNGIGPEVALKSVVSRTVRNICTPVLVGSLDVFEHYARRFRIRLNLREAERDNLQSDSGDLPVVNILPSANPSITPGKQTTAAGSWAGMAVTTAVELCVAGNVHGMVTAPVSKISLNEGGFKFAGQTEMVAALSGRSVPTMMLVARNFRVGLVTVHLPVNRISRTITSKLIAQRLRTIHGALVGDFNIRAPKIGVLGLNPHAGEDGLLGNEELTQIAPAIKSARKRHIQVDGPFPADGFFGTHSHENYDAVLAMYHDQGLIPIKMSSFERGVNYSAGLQIIRTSPAHGTAFGIAGKGIANPSSMIEAIKLAVTIVHNRRKLR
ncbi:MAG TPA: 4-hydroxythreonine-4-phosphate dehydrogenase PdxA [Bacteroidota bacterium]|jgi:4-hydroxythreonine-4-phosphate dehydrogenase|nr:4-hydroxythreonine-4-phosphate dehydrogenase PdxA [Bacteroidota bacterium]